MESNEFDKALLSTKAFKYLDMHELNVIKVYCKSAEFHDNDILFAQGKKSSAMQIILKGKALVIGRVLGKKNMILGTLDQGNFFGEISLIQKTACPATVIASDEVQCLLITASYFDMLALFFPEIRYKITKAIAEEICSRLRELNKNIRSIIEKSEIVKTPFINKLSNLLGTNELTKLDDTDINKKDLKKIEVFNAFTEAELDEFLNHAEFVKTSGSCQLIKEGSLNSPYFLIIQGAVQLSITVNNRTAKLAVLGPESLFGSLSLVDNQPAIINYTTYDRAILLKISEDNLRLLEKSNPQLWHKLYHHICKYIVMLESTANKLIIRLNNEQYNR